MRTDYQYYAMTKESLLKEIDKIKKYSSEYENSIYEILQLSQNSFLSEFVEKFYNLEMPKRIAVYQALGYVAESRESITQILGILESEKYLEENIQNQSASNSQEESSQEKESIVLENFFEKLLNYIKETFWKS